MLAFDARDTAALAAAHAVRRAVFILEQGIAETIEMDGADGACRHVLAVRHGAPVGTARLRPLGGGRAKVERMAVLEPWRREGIGRSLVGKLESEAASRGLAELVLHAQGHAAPFYRGLGYVRDGEVFEEAGIPHVKMRKRLAP